MVRAEEWGCGWEIKDQGFQEKERLKRKDLEKTNHKGNNTRKATISTGN